MISVIQQRQSVHLILAQNVIHVGERNARDQRGGARGRADDRCPRPGGSQHAEALRSAGGPAQGKPRATNLNRSTKLRSSNQC